MSASDPAEPLIATSSLTVGPFFHVGPAQSDEFGRVVAPDAAGEQIHLAIRVLDGDAVPVSDAMIEVWQPGTGFGRLGTGHDGWCRFETIRPGATAGSAEAPHVNVCVFARGL